MASMTMTMATPTALSSASATSFGHPLSTASAKATVAYAYRRQAAIRAESAPSASPVKKIALAGLAALAVSSAGPVEPASAAWVPRYKLRAATEKITEPVKDAVEGIADVKGNVASALDGDLSAPNPKEAVAAAKRVVGKAAKGLPSLGGVVSEAKKAAGKAKELVGDASGVGLPIPPTPDVGKIANEAKDNVGFFDSIKQAVGQFS